VWFLLASWRTLEELVLLAPFQPNPRAKRSSALPAAAGLAEVSAVK